jgi:NOL1/NOP2/sun family putative RNA methylase
MSSKEFFSSRYAKLGWQFKETRLTQAIRINTSNSRGKNIVQRLESIGVKLEKIPFLKTGYWVKDSTVSAGATAEYLLGLYSIQEAAAQIPATLFTTLDGKTVYDACAAPGGKTVQLADLMNNTGIIVASDIKKKRLTALTNHLERCGVTNTLVYDLDARRAHRLEMKFNRILIDAPCSGNFASDRNWFKRRTISDVDRNARLQKDILKQAIVVLAENGEIVYSTCSLEPEENELNIDWALRNLDLQVEEIDCYGQKGLTDVFGNLLDKSIEKCKRIWPRDTQGFFVCKLKRRGDKS